jgi:hypothetical protein
VLILKFDFGAGAQNPNAKMNPPALLPSGSPSRLPINDRPGRFLVSLWAVGVGSVLLVAAFVLKTYLFQRIGEDINEARNNLRSMSLALCEFEAAYGSFPNAATAVAVKQTTETHLPLGSESSNDLFRQLLAAEISTSESIFYAKIPDTHPPDNLYHDGSCALVEGEVGFSCMVGLDSKSHPNRPLVVTPLVPGTNKFDPIPFNGKAIILRVNSGVEGRIEVLPITSRGEVIDASGKHILDPSNPIWNGEIPTIAWPQLVQGGSATDRAGDGSGKMKRLKVVGL